MAIWEGDVRRGYVKLHFASNVPTLDDGQGVPLVIVPGLAESADDYADLLELLAPRPCFALDLRGRGQSSAPQHGYTLADHVDDITALLDTINLPPFCLMAYGYGVPYALGFAADHPDALAGLIVLDYPAQQTAVTPEWTERILSSTSRGVPVTEKIMPHVVEGVQQDSADIDLWEALPRITCPALIGYGKLPGARLSVPQVERYLTTLPNARAIRFEDSDHRLWEPDYGQYVMTIARFVSRLDG